MLFVLGGQSNMVGHASSGPLPADLKQPEPRVAVFEHGRWVQLQPGRTFGPELSLGHALAAAFPDETIGIVKHAVDGTSLLAWSPRWNVHQAGRTENSHRGPLYQELMRKVRTARQHSPAHDAVGPTTAPPVAGLFWMQGERDAMFPELAAEYEHRLKTLIRRLRIDCGAPHVPFVLGQISPPVTDPFPGRNKVRDAQARVARADDQVAMVSTDDLQKLADNLHFGAQGNLELGRRMARAFLRLAPPATTRAGRHD